MICIKTGFHGYLVQYGEFVYGDAYAESEDSGALCLRICSRSRKPMGPRINVLVHASGQWFDRDAKPGQNSTLVASENDWENTGYQGREFTLENGKLTLTPVWLPPVLEIV